jgi:hypothetical protein
MNEQEGKNFLKKLYEEDIPEAQKKLSDIQNEIARRTIEAEKVLDQKYQSRTAQLEREYEKRKAGQDAREKYLDEYMTRLDTKERELTEQKKVQDGKEKILSDKQERLTLEVNKFNQELSDADKKVQKHVLDIEAKSKLQAEKDKALDLRAKNLDEREASFESTLKKIDEKIVEDNEVLKKNELVLSEIHLTEENIKTESSIIKENLGSIQKEKEDLISLSAIKDDIALLNQERANFEEEKKKLLILSKQVEARDVVVTEKERTNDEKEKYLMIKDRAVQGKIDILNKIRQGNA